MRASPLVLAIAIGLGFSLPANDAANAASTVQAVKSTGIKTFIVTFEEVPLASFRGSDGKKFGMPKMAATSPSVTSEPRLNLNSPATANYRIYLAKERKTRLELASQKLGRTLTPIFVYDAAIHGFAANMSDAEAATMRTIPGVKRVQQEVIRRLMTDRGPAWIKADQVWAGGGVPAITGTKGAGIVIGVIDTGLNRTHPSFAGSGTAGNTFAETFTITNPKPGFLGRCAVAGQASKCNSKVIGLWDYVAGSGTTGDADDTDGHGTHTASTTSGNPVKVTIPGGAVAYIPTMSGVAPRANLVIYKACDATGCPGSKTLAGINQAILDGVNVISYSIGGGPSDPYSGLTTPAIDSDEEAFLAARNANIVSSVAAGNDGPAVGTVGSPSNAPWVMSVAATTHDRALVRPLVLTGGNTALPGGGTLLGSGSTAGTLIQTPLSKDAAFPLCGSGTDSDDSFSGVSRPASWTPTTFFAGRLVACQRGFYARRAKAVNVEIAGGTGMILYNQQSEGDSLISDTYSIPTVHLTYADGLSFLAWLNSGTGHTGQILAASWNNQASFGDKLASFSGRGPVIPTGIIKPDIAAPGVDIYAAGLGSGATCTTNSMTGTNCAASLSGTSMATPHVAGAMALIKAVNPSWTPNQIISALSLTARATVTVNGVIGTPHEIGAGQTDVSKAVRAGVFLPVTDAQFKATTTTTANTLNLPSLGNSNCFESCVLPRTFTDMVGGGAYTIVSTLPAGATMTPSASSLTFTNGQTQSVNFTFNVNNPALTGSWVYGSVTLQNNTPSNGRPNLTLPVAIYASAFSDVSTAPTSIDITASTERGFFDHTFFGMAALPDARFVAGDLVVPKVSTPSLAEDPTPASPYDALTTGIFTDTFTIPASPVGGPVVYKVKINTSSLTAIDADLFVGTGTTPSAATETCTSTSGSATEVCEFEVTTSGSPQTYWLMVQNYKAGTSPPDVVRIESYQAPVQAGTTGTLVATGPGKVISGASFKVRIAWDDPSFVGGQKRIGYLMVQSTNGHTAFRIPVNLTRTGTTVEPFALTNNVARDVTLTANGAQDKLFFIVPPHATSVTFSTTSASNVDLYVAKATAPDDPNVSAIPAAPARGFAQFGQVNATGNETVTVTGSALLSGGRWYVTPVNMTAGTVTLTVKATVNTQGTPPAFLSGQYVNTSRDGHGMFVDFAGPIGNPDQWVTVWYTYLEDGTPTWYYTQAPVPTANGIWRANLLRVVWNGSAASATDVGDLIITETGASTMTVSYNIDGKTGSETMARVGGGSCPSFNTQTLDVTGHWYSPDKSGFGYSFIATGGGSPQEVMIPYVYDSVGFPRWIYGQKGFDSAATSTHSFQWFSGFGPIAPKVALTGTAAGSGTRTLATNNITNMSVNSTFTGLLTGTWVENRAVAQLSQRKNCQ